MQKQLSYYLEQLSMEPRIKTMDTTYIIKVNDEPVTGLASRAEARQYVKFMTLDDSVRDVKIVKRTTTEQVLRVYTAQQKIALKAIDLDEGLDDN